MSAQDRGLGANTHFQRFAGGLGGYHAEPAQARVVSDSNGVLLTMIPTSSGGFCHTAAISQNATLLAEGALCSYGPQTTPHLNDTPVLYRAGTSRTPRPWVGILPDGLSNLTAIYSDGTQGAVPLTTDRAFTLESSKDVTAFTYTDSAGQSHRIAAG